MSCEQAFKHAQLTTHYSYISIYEIAFSNPDGCKGPFTTGRATKCSNAQKNEEIYQRCFLKSLRFCVMKKI